MNRLLPSRPPRDRPVELKELLNTLSVGSFRTFELGLRWQETSVVEEDGGVQKRISE